MEDTSKSRRQGNSLVRVAIIDHLGGTRILREI
jgi:hypothetical protein